MPMDKSDFLSSWMMLFLFVKMLVDLRTPKLLFELTLPVELSVA